MAPFTMDWLCVEVYKIHYMFSQPNCHRLFKGNYNFFFCYEQSNTWVGTFHKFTSNCPVSLPAVQASIGHGPFHKSPDVVSPGF